MSRLVRIALLVGVAIFGIIFVVYQLTSSQKLTVNVSGSSDAQVFIYKVPKNVDLHEAEDDYLVEEQLLKQSKSGEEVKIKKGNYVVLFSGNDDLVRSSEIVQLGGEPMTISLKPEITDKKRETLLAGELAAINQAISDQLKMPPTFSVSKPQLFGDGSWYGAIASTTLSQEAYIDVYKFVMHKENGAWKLVAGPELNLSKIVYPDVPEEILRAINALRISED